MLTCTFENGGTTSLRHVVVHAIVEKDGESIGFYLKYGESPFAIPIVE